RTLGSGGAEGKLVGPAGASLGVEAGAVAELIRRQRRRARRRGIEQDVDRAEQAGVYAAILARVAEELRRPADRRAGVARLVHVRAVAAKVFQDAGRGGYTIAV